MPPNDGPYGTSTGQCLINAAGSTGRCNTIPCIDSTTLPGRSDLFGCPSSKPSQGSVSADLILESDLALVFNASRARLECCVDLLRSPRLSDMWGTRRNLADDRGAEGPARRKIRLNGAGPSGRHKEKCESVVVRRRKHQRSDSFCGSAERCDH
jgi:hypothetical protein